MSLDLSHLAEPDLRAIVDAGPDQVPAHYREAAREALGGSERAQESAAPKPSTPQTPEQRMTRTERRMAAVLDADPAVLRWSFEALSFRVGQRSRYRPDFYVVRAGGVELIEVKRVGMWQTAHAASKVRFEAAAMRYPEYAWSWWEWDGQAGAFVCRRRYEAEAA